MKNILTILLASATFLLLSRCAKVNVFQEPPDAPVIDSLSPATGRVGTQVRLWGSGFSTFTSLDTVWINGVRADQSATRAAMKVEQPAKHGCLRFHPMLDWNAKMIWQYQKEYSLPKHPLEEKGFVSIGCEPCTRKLDPEMQEREARWFGMNKVECGLHTDLINK